MNILLLEDDRHLGRMIKDELKQRNYQVTWTQNLTGARRELHNRFDLALIDLNLPDGEGFDLVSRLHCPIVIMSALSDPHNRLRGAEMGVYDFIPKPFLMEELFLKIEKILGEAPASDRIWSLGSVSVNLNYRQITQGEQTHLLNKRDFRLLEILTKRYPSVVSRDEIIDYVYGPDQNTSHRTVDNAVVGLRQRLGDSKSQWIRSVRGEGYQWMVKGSRNG